jgi:hypothetical protein
VAEFPVDPPLTLVSAGDDGVVVLTLNRPGKKNALSIALRDEVVARLRALAADEAVKAVVVTGGGGSFSAGFDLREGQSTSSSYFGDASQNGEDVFFFTRQSLVSQDRDNNVDVYDAREDGGISSQNSLLAPPSERERCRGASTTAPALGVPENPR